MRTNPWDWVLPVVFASGFLGILALILSIWFVEVPRQAQAAAQHAAACAARSLKPAETTERTGRTSTTARFCVDAAGRVYWPYRDEVK